ncbi:hypothetical protein M4951_03850 [Blastopirellula sp. J2-11]|uniref:hypothetical protein n=1 Tax=Blastopirellula sp. J2-11 TaxID=2943192 RepID=UPI0021C5F1D5|nr:hypothetical protein [Blastopirellula sp. J2-11]UUO07449.1 hypothetical protein M4951_03850 [Blastopirellula sp. J2-11]
MESRRAMELIDAHLDGETLSDADAAALTEWIKQNEKQADDAFRRIFLHSYLRQRIQTLGLLPSIEGETTQPNLRQLDGGFDSPAPPTRAYRFTPTIVVLIFLAAILGGLMLPSVNSLPRTRRSAPFAYEGFDYAPYDAPVVENEWPTEGGLDGMNGGLGFSGAWVESGNLVSLIEANPSDHPWTPHDMRQFGMLGYSDRFGGILASSGNQLRTSAGPQSITSRRLDVTAAPASLLDGDAIGADGSSLWISFLTQSFDSSGDGRYAYLQLGQNNTGLRIGKLRTAPSGNWSVAAVTDGAELNLRSSDKPSGEGVLIVARIDFRPGAEQATIWINPDLNQPPDDAQSTLRLPTPDFRLDQISIAGRYSTDFDEIRLGANFRDVTPIAEKPASP